MPRPRTGRLLTRNGRPVACIRPPHSLSRSLALSLSLTKLATANARPQALKEALEKNARLDLAEAAAAKSAQVLKETQARTALGHGLLVTTHVIYLMIGMLSVLATGLLTLVN